MKNEAKINISVLFPKLINANNEAYEKDVLVSCCQEWH